MSKRNIILVTIDSLRADHCSCMGYQRNTTPTLDKMSVDGLVYENAIAPGIPTGHSMMGTFTGEFSSIVTGDFTKETWLKEFYRRQTLAEVLSNAGYTTGAFHANPYASSHFGFNKGFDEFNDFIKDNELQTLTTNSTFNEYLTSIKRLIQGEGTNVSWEQLYGFINDWIGNAKDPYFLWILLLDTHTPYLPPKSHKKWSTHGKLRLIYEHWRAQRHGWNLENGQTIDRLRNAYDDTIRYADDFLNQIRGDSVEDDPVIIVHGDHGEGFGEHGFLRHPPKLYEELVHVPLVISNVETGGRIRDPVSLRELPATIIDIAEVDREIQGKSFVNAGRKWVYTQIFNKDTIVAAVRMEDWKLIYRQNHRNELYNLGEDPHEQFNVINRFTEVGNALEKLVNNHTRDQEIRKLIQEVTKEVKL